MVSGTSLQFLVFTPFYFTIFCNVMTWNQNEFNWDYAINLPYSGEATMWPRGTWQHNTSTTMLYCMDVVVRVKWSVGFSPNVAVCVKAKKKKKFTYVCSVFKCFQLAQVPADGGSLSVDYLKTTCTLRGAGYWTDFLNWIEVNITTCAFHVFP